MELTWFWLILKEETSPKSNSKNASWYIFTNMGIRVLLKTFPPQQLRIVLHARLLTALTGRFSLFGRPKIGEIACLAVNMCSQSSMNSFFTPAFLVSLDFFLAIFVNELACLNHFCGLRKSEFHHW